MSMKKGFIKTIASLLITLSCAFTSNAQDVKAYVRVNAEQIGGTSTNREIYDEMNQALTEFINSFYGFFFSFQKMDRRHLHGG